MACMMPGHGEAAFSTCVMSRCEGETIAPQHALDERGGVGAAGSRFGCGIGGGGF